MPKNSVVETTVVKPVEQLLLLTIINPEFRSELLTNPEAFDLPVHTEHLLLPQSVAPQDMSFVELVKDFTDIGACKNTCSSGFTIKCDGNTQADSSNCKCTCTTGLTVRCDGSSYK